MILTEKVPGSTDSSPSQSTEMFCATSNFLYAPQASWPMRSSTDEHLWHLMKTPEKYKPEKLYEKKETTVHDYLIEKVFNT